MRRRDSVPKPRTGLGVDGMEMMHYEQEMADSRLFELTFERRLAAVPRTSMC